MIVFSENTILQPPAGLALADFNASLAAEIKSHLTFYRKAMAIRNAWRDNNVTQSERPAYRAFTAAIRREVERYIAKST